MDVFSYHYIVPIISVIIGVLIFLLGGLTYLHQRRALVNKIFFLLSLSTVFWIGCIVFRFTTNDQYFIVLGTRLSYVAAVLIGFFVNLFCYYFPKKNNYKLPYYFIIPFTAFVLYLSAFTEYIIGDINLLNSHQVNVFGELLYIFIIYFPLMVAWGIFNLTVKRKHLNKSENFQVKFVLWGILLSFIVGVSTNLFIPSLFNTTATEKYGPLAVIFLIFFIAYAIVKHQLMNVKLIATELFSTFISLILLIDALLAKTWLEFLLKFGLFVGIAIFSVLLIRGVLNEVKARERIAAMAETLKKANRDLKKLDKAKSEFISIASHQLRTPLSVIKGYLSMILEGFYGKIPKKVRKRIEYSMESNERLIKLVDSLLDLSHMEGGRMEFNFKKISFSDLVESVYQEYKETIKKKGLKMSFKKPDKKRFYVEADEQKLRQVIANLVDNAIKYTKKGGIKIKLNKEDGNVVFSVKDSGIGIDPEEKKQLFKKFIRGKKVSRLWTGGVGLGLYVARLIVEEHKGEIGLESKGEGKGSKFWVKLPLIG